MTKLASNLATTAGLANKFTHTGPTRPTSRPASPDDLKARLKVTRFAKYPASDKTVLVGTVRGKAKFGQTGFERQLTRFSLVVVLVSLVSVLHKMKQYQYVISFILCRPGQVSILKANENFGWKSCLVALESNPARARNRIQIRREVATQEPGPISPQPNSD